ncbi:MAG: TIGR04283 family arsenosugar biosynthesis glycosyltransferase [Candidatus Omnitrophica bacterium]|nr:TIGR04283 family arsenosugar biosynthesis glycosyltransferase [Candidatus Omnitrophota bacterium]
MISIIIPVYNEEEFLSKNDIYYQIISQVGELIFVDGGSTDRTVSLAKKLGRVIISPQNRGAQMNRGAQEAKRRILLFLHADAFIHLENLQQIVKAIEGKKYIGGCFSQVLDDPAILYRWIAWTGNFRAKVSKVFYGDQAIFVRKDVFQGLGGFPEVKIGEDILFTKKLRRKGKVGVLPFAVNCSTRRWKRQGVWQTFLLNLRINTALVWNKDLDQLANAYQDVRENIKR